MILKWCFLYVLSTLSMGLSAESEEVNPFFNNTPDTYDVLNNPRNNLIHSQESEEEEPPLVYPSFHYTLRPGGREADLEYEKMIQQGVKNSEKPRKKYVKNELFKTYINWLTENEPQETVEEFQRLVCEKGEDIKINEIYELFDLTVSASASMLLPGDKPDPADFFMEKVKGIKRVVMALTSELELIKLLHDFYLTKQLTFLNDKYTEYLKTYKPSLESGLNPWGDNQSYHIRMRVGLIKAVRHHFKEFYPSKNFFLNKKITDLIKKYLEINYDFLAECYANRSGFTQYAKNILSIESRTFEHFEMFKKEQHLNILISGLKKSLYDPDKEALKELASKATEKMKEIKENSTQTYSAVKLKENVSNLTVNLTAATSAVTEYVSAWGWWGKPEESKPKEGTKKKKDWE